MGLNSLELLEGRGSGSFLHTFEYRGEKFVAKTFSKEISIKDKIFDWESESICLENLLNIFEKKKLGEIPHRVIAATFLKEGLDLTKRDSFLKSFERLSKLSSVQD